MEHYSNSPISHDYSQLPEELLLHIFGYCDPKSWGLSQSVCQVWRQVCLDKRFVFSFDFDFSTKRFTKEEWSIELNRLSKITSSKRAVISRLNLSNSNCMEFFIEPAETIPSLIVKKLILDQIYQTNLMGSFTYRENLRGVALTAILTATTGLEILTFRNFSYEGSTAKGDHIGPFHSTKREMVKNHLLSLKKLTIQYKGWQKIDFFSELFPNLQELNLINTCHSISFKGSDVEAYGFQALQESLPNLKITKNNETLSPLVELYPDLKYNKNAFFKEKELK